jgi:hypothetical protein
MYIRGYGLKWYTGWSSALLISNRRGALRGTNVQKPASKIKKWSDNMGNESL